MASANLNLDSNRSDLLLEVNSSSPPNHARAGHCRVAFNKQAASALPETASNPFSTPQFSWVCQSHSVPAGCPRCTLTKIASASPDSDRFDYVLTIELGQPSTITPEGNLGGALEGNAISATGSPDGYHFTLSEYEWPPLPEASTPPKKEGKASANGNETNETVFSEDSPAFEIEEEQQGSAQHFRGGATYGVVAPAGIVPIMVGTITQTSKILFVDPSDITVNETASKFWDLLPSMWKNGEFEKFFLRIDTQTNNMLANFADTYYASPRHDNEEVNERSSHNETSEEDDVEAIEAMAETVAAYMIHVKGLSIIRRKFGDQALAIRTHSEVASILKKDCKFPLKMTSSWNIHQVLREDRSKAQLDFGRVAHAWTITRAMSEDDILASFANEEFASMMTEELLTAVRAQPITLMEFNNRVRNGDIQSAKQRMRFHRFTELVDLYVKGNWKLPSELQREFELQWLLVIDEVFSRVHGVFTTCNIKLIGDYGAIFHDETERANPAWPSCVESCTYSKRCKQNIYVFSEEVFPDGEW